MEIKYAITQIFKYSLNKFSLLFVFFLSFAFNQAISQTYTTTDKKAIKKYIEAQAFYQKYDLKSTRISLNEAIERDPKFIEAQTLLAYTYLDQGDYETAKSAFRTCIEIDVNVIPNNLFFLGELELKSGEYELAENRFEQFLSLNEIDPKLESRSRRSLDIIDFAKRAVNNPVPFEPINLGPNINSELSEYFPSITVDQNKILFTRRLINPDSPQGYNEDFYMSIKKNGEWQKAINIQKPINSIMNEGAPTLSADGQLLIFTACELYGNYGGQRKGKGSCDLFYSSYDGKIWTTPINLGSTINTPHWETQPSFSADGKTLYFVRGIRSRTGTKTGDIYVSRLDEKNYWSKPEKLSRTINTPANEESVFIHPDGKTLYFSSDGHIGMGGLDIFVSKLDEEGNWGKPVNLGYPINTFKNENSLLVGADGKIAYFASDRAQGIGELDLYSFELPAQFSPEKVSYFAGKIYDVKTKKPLAANFELIDLESEKVIVQSESNPKSGEFLVTLPSGRNYALNASKDGYLFYSENFALKDNNNNTPFKQDVPMNPIEIGEKIVLKNIFFETAKYDLKAESMVELKKLKSFLNDNSSIKIEISGHTDNVGNENANQILSENRAKTVYNYLIKEGIVETRLSWKGYGANLPISDNDTELGRSKNRRTEFKILDI